PSAACGVVGLKASLGEVPTDGVVPLSTTFDHVGPLTRTVTDAVNIWAVLTERRSANLQPQPARKVVLGALGDYFTALLDADVRSSLGNAIEELKRAGVRVESRSVAGTSGIVDAYVNVSLPE